MPLPTPTPANRKKHRRAAVQCGSWQNAPAALVNASVGAGGVRTAAKPRNWGNQELLDDVIMTSDYSLAPDALRVEFGLEYAGEYDHPLRVQVGAGGPRLVWLVDGVCCVRADGGQRHEVGRLQATPFRCSWLDAGA